MSDKGILDPRLIELTRRCSHLDRLTNEIHQALRGSRVPVAGMRESVVAEVAATADLCAKVIRNFDDRSHGKDTSVQATFFALRAACEALEALITAGKVPLVADDERPSGTKATVGSRAGNA